MGFWAQVGQFFVDNWQLLLQLTGGQIVLCLAAVGAAMVIALPIGIVVGHLHRWSFLAINGGNVLRALPTLAVISVGIAIYGFGFFNIWVALIVLAVPLILTNTYVAVDGVAADLVEAARGMGMNAWQIVWRVELPSAVPLIMAGIRTATVYVIATAYLAAFAGTPGTLGDIIVNQSGFTLAGVMAASIVAVVIAFLAEFLLAAVERLLTPRGLKLEAAAADASVVAAATA
jgi:osmoprotectant transport system permease protein